MSESQKPVEVPVKDCIDDILLLSSVRDDARASLVDMLECFRGRKCLFYDKQLGGILAQLSNDMKKFYQECGVYYFRELSGNLQDFINECGKDIPENVIFLVRPNLSTMKTIAESMLGIQRLGARSQFRVCFAPCSTTICLHFLEEMVHDVEIWERISFKDYKIGLMPFDSDLLSFEIDDVFKQCYVDGDLSMLSVIAHGLAKLQSQFGVIPNIKSKGVGARKVLQRMMHHRVEEEGSIDHDQKRQDDLKTEINTLIILDREVDLVSPLVTPLTYEGLVDITLGIDYGRIRVESVLLGSEETNDLGGVNKSTTGNHNTASMTNEKVTLLLNNNDSIFAEIRNLSIERLGSYMQEKAIHIRERYAAFKGNKDASLAEIHDFVKKIPKLTKDFKSLNQHIHIAELLKKTTDSTDFRDYWQHERAILEGESALDFIEELLFMDVHATSLNQILKLLCLQSLTYGGVRGNRYDTIRRLISQVYGMHHLFTLNNLEKAGLIKRKDAILVVDTSSTWPTLKKQLRLIDEKVNVIKPDDINYVASGYGPLLVRIVQVIAQATASTTNLPTAFLELLKLLPGPFLDFLQSSVAEELGDQLSRLNIEPTVSNVSQSMSSAGTLVNNMVNAASDFGSIAMNSRLPIFRKDGNDDINNVAAFGGRIKDDNSQTQVSKKVMLVVVIGGLSYLELAAFRFLSNEPAFPFKIIVATTKLMSGSNLLNTLHYKP